MDLPLYFPHDYNRRLAGFGDEYRKKFHVVFQDYGRVGHVDVSYGESQASSEDQQPVFIAQRQHKKQRDRSALCATCPTLPLSSTPVSVSYPFHDPVIGDTQDLPAKVHKFSKSVIQVSSSFRQGVSWEKQFKTAKRTLDQLSHGDEISDFRLQTLRHNLPPSLARLTDMYEDLCSQPSFLSYNGRYSGGMLSCVSEGQGDQLKHLLFHAKGQDLTTLALTLASPTSSQPLIASELLAETELSPVYQVQAACVQGGVWVAARHSHSCSVFLVDRRDDTDTQLTAAGTWHCEEGELVTSVCLSPYLPGEALLCTSQAKINIWDVNRGLQRTIIRQPRFECDDSWLHAYYAGHPRQLVVADRTAVRMLDHRDSFGTSVELFALPSPLVHGKEQIMAASLHGSGSPLHLVACSRSLFLVDQRFGGTPVMQWYPDLQGHLQYLASTDYLTAGGRTSGLVLVGSQSPAEVMCYPFSHGSGQAVTSSLSPWRLSTLTDVADTERYHCFLGNTDPSFFQQRVSKSLGGVAVAPGARPASIVTYQLDCYGEVYFQQYGTPSDSRSVSKTGLSAPGEKEPYVSSAVQAHVQSWLQQQRDDVQEKAERGGEQESQTIPTQRCWAFREEGTVDGVDCVTQYCLLCKDSIGSTGSGGQDRFKGLCSNCIELRCNVFGETAPSPVVSSCAEDFPDGGQNRSGGSGDGLRFLDKVLPTIESYEDDAFTSVHLELMKPQPEILEKVKQREEKHMEKVQEGKEKRRSARKRKREKAKRGMEEQSNGSTEDSRPVTEHSVFNSAEHLQENKLIQDILAKKMHCSTDNSEDVALDAGQDVVDARNVEDSDMEGDVDAESSRSSVRNSSGHDEDGNCSVDLFEDSEEESGVGTSRFVSFSQEDDDDFFGSVDACPSLSASFCA